MTQSALGNDPSLTQSSFKKFYASWASTTSDISWPCGHLFGLVGTFIVFPVAQAAANIFHGPKEC